MKPEPAIFLPQPEPNRSPAWDWTFFWRAEDAWQAMYRACEEARRSIDFEQYILRNDKVGRQFMKLFARKAAQGVHVRLLCDMVGSWDFYLSREAEQLRQAGVELRFFNPLHWKNIFTRLSALPRNHTKTMLIDREIAFVGGVCIDERMRDWRDTHIRVPRKVAELIEPYFAHVWEHGQRHWPLQLHPTAIHLPEGGFAYVTSNPLLNCNLIYRQLKKHLHNAQRIVYLTSPFFIPSRKLSWLLCRAARRGVDVRLLLSEVSDVRAADIISRSYLGRVMRAGVRIFLYQGTVMHAKTAVVDDWATVGSMNLDHLSLFRNYEANLVISERRAVGELTERFLADLELCREYTLDDWNGRSPLSRFLGFAGRFFKHIL